MFTGLISDVGEIIAVETLSAGKRFEISCSYDADTIPMGASIACDGACMTVISDFLPLKGMCQFLHPQKEPKNEFK